MIMHGSISRTGKTRAYFRWAHPEVKQKIRTRKLLTGRAKKRLLYNRRIKNAAALRGRGPNFQGETYAKPTIDGPVMNMTFVPKKRLSRSTRSGTDIPRYEDTIPYNRYLAFRYRVDRTHHRKVKGVQERNVMNDRISKIAEQVSALYPPVENDFDSEYDD
jgi:ribosomal protein S30